MSFFSKAGKGIFFGFFSLLFGLGLWVTWPFIFLSSKEGPSKLIWGKQVCSHCGMHIDDPAFASQVQLKTANTLFFDDTGCLAHYFDQHKEEESSVTSMYFWLDAEEKWFVSSEVSFIHDSSLMSPMGYHFKAVKKGKRLKAKAFSFNEMKEKILEDSLKKKEKRN